MRQELRDRPEWQRGSECGRARSGTSGELLLAPNAADRLGGFVRKPDLEREAGGERAPLRPLGLEAIGDETSPDILEAGDRVVVRNDAVRVDAHHRAAGIGPVQTRPAAIRPEPETAGPHPE